MQLAFPNVNLALDFLDSTGKTIDDYTGWCSTVSDEVLKRHEGSVVYVDGEAVHEYNWCYHQVPLVNGKIHDAWYAAWNQDFEPLSLEDWLVKMFGTEDEIGVTIDGTDIYEGLPQHFNPNQKLGER